jgi:hypothetical protein
LVVGSISTPSAQSSFKNAIFSVSEDYVTWQVVRRKSKRSEGVCNSNVVFPTRTTTMRLLLLQGVLGHGVKTTGVASNKLWVLWTNGLWVRALAL